MDTVNKLNAAKPTESTIFHYTSLDGLLGIVQSKSLWASSIRHLSDAADFGYALDLAREKLNRKLKAERGPWNTYYGEILRQLDWIDDWTSFVGSFSEDGDLLSQWRAYTPNGIGFSVGMEYQSLVALAASQDFRLIKCIYDSTEHDIILEELIVDSAALIKNGNTDNAVTGFIVRLMMYAPALKHPAFSEEREWRLVSSFVGADPWDSSVTRFRSGKSMLIPYQEFRLARENEKLTISTMYVGPNPHLKLSVSSLSQLLKAGNVQDGCQIRAASAPYRTW